MAERSASETPRAPGGLPPDATPADGARATKPWIWPAAIGLTVVAHGSLLVVDAVEGTLREGVAEWSVAAWLVAFAGFGLAVWHNERRPVAGWWLWGVPVAVRLALALLTDPTLSDDVYRYLWDGHVWTNGVNPYRYPVDAPELDHLAIGARDLVNFPSLGTEYLPTTQVVFAVTSLILPSEPWSLQLVLVAFDLATAVVIGRLLVLLGHGRHRLVLYLWNPLVIVEVAHGAHLDPVSTCFVVVALWLTVRARRRADTLWWAAPTALAAATLTRPVPALLAAVVGPRWSWRQRVLCVVVAVAAVVPFGLGAGFGLDADNPGTGVFGSARVIGQDFRFNSGLYHWVETGVLGGVDDPRPVMQAVIAVVVAVVLSVVWRRASSASDLGLVRSAAAPLVLFVLITPVLQPWYLVVTAAIVPFLVPAPGESLRRWAYAAPFLWLQVTVGLSYLAYAGDGFAEVGWVRVVEWVPFWLLSAVAAREVRRAGLDIGLDAGPAS